MGWQAAGRYRWWCNPADEPEQGVSIKSDLLLPFRLALEQYGSKWEKPHNVYYVTELITPPRIVQLRARHKDKIPVDPPEKLHKALNGNGFHYMLDKCLRRHPRKDEFLLEYRMWDKFYGRKVVGKLDGYHKPSRIIFDYKTTSVFKAMMGDYSDFEDQLNIYAFLLEQERIPVDGLVVIMYHFEWNKFQKMTDKKYPDLFHAHEVSLWPYDEREEFLMDKLQDHIAAEEMDDEHLPKCTAKDRWDRETKYAVMEPGAKRASRVMDDKEKLLEWVQWREKEGKPLKEGWAIEERSGGRMRCEEYCDVNFICGQYQSYLKRCQSKSQR